VVFINNSK